MNTNTFYIDLVQGPNHGTSVQVPGDADSPLPPHLHFASPGEPSLVGRNGFELAKVRDHYMRAGTNPVTGNPQYVWTAPDPEAT